jgi:hypothetical protein
MNAPLFQKSLLARDQKAFLELTSDEVETWVPIVFEHIRPHIHLMQVITDPRLFLDPQTYARKPEESDPFDIGEDENQFHEPLNLEIALMIASQSVREVAAEMADHLLTVERQQRLFPAISAYCDELLARGRDLDATFVQQGLIGILQGIPPRQNPLLIEICMRSIHQQVSMINGGSRSIRHAL